MLVAVWHILTTGEAYRNPGADYFADATPTEDHDGSLRNSKGSDTPSHPNGQHQWQHQALSLPGPGFVLRSSDAPDENLDAEFERLRFARIGAARQFHHGGLPE